MFLYSFLSLPAAFVVYKSQPPVTWQSGVSKLSALVTTSKSRSGKNCGEAISIHACNDCGAWGAESNCAPSFLRFCRCSMRSRCLVVVAWSGGVIGGVGV